MERKSKRGFAAMSPEKQREIAAMGGRTVQSSGKGRRWTKGDENAILAGRKGGAVSNGGRGKSLSEKG